MANINGTNGNDTLVGTADADTINGGGGDDTLVGGGGNDLLDGGNGEDTLYGDEGDDTLRGGGGADILMAGNGNDTLEGGNNDDKLYGEGGDDLLFGDGGADELHGGAGNDALEGGNGEDTLYGDDGDDTLFGNDGADELHGGDGNDTLDGGSNIDTMIGGLGDDLYIVNHVSDTVIEADGEGFDTVKSSVSFTLGTGVENLVLTGGADRSGTGNALDNNFTGNSGDNLLDGGAGLDRAIYTNATGGITVNLAAGTVTGAGIGSDTLRSIEFIRGSDFADVYNATGFGPSSTNAGSVTYSTPDGKFNEFEGRGGNDTITGNGSTRISYEHASGGVTVNIATGTATGDASVGTDTFTGVYYVRGSNYVDTLTGSDDPGLQNFDGRGGADMIDGAGGFDRAVYQFDMAAITVNMAAGTVTGGSGNDTLRAVESVRGSAFADTYVATGFNGTSTNAGSLGTFNEFEGMGGNDTITGNGATRLAFYLSTGGVTVDIAAGTAVGNATVGSDMFTGVNAVAGSYFNDSLSGSSNSDTFDGRTGDDFIDGRGGFDTAIYNNESSAVTQGITTGMTIDMAAGTVIGDIAVGTDTLRSIESIRATNFDDIYVATGFSASSTNAGSNGTFNMFEGLGGDDIITGNGNTQVAFGNATAGVTVNLAHGTASGDASVGADTFTGVNAVVGSRFADLIDGDASSNLLNAQAGDDTVNGGDGNDNLIGGLGADTLDGGNGIDQASYNNATAGVTVSLLTGLGSGGEAQGDVLSGIENLQGSQFADTLTGDGGSNQLLGLSGNDVLISGDGNDNLSGGNNDDTLDGGADNDSLTGGGGNDLFVFADGYGADTITDFVAGAATDDVIDLNGVTSVANFADVLAVASQSGANTVIDFGGGDIITLSNVLLSSLHQDDFLF